MRLALAAIAVFVLAAGCLSPSTPAPLTDAGLEAQYVPGLGPVDPKMLSQPTFDLLGQAIEYVESTLDGILLYSEIYLPEGSGPWPTILEMSPYNNLRANGHADGAADALPVETISMSGGLVNFYVPRGYAVVLAHVRGTGNSEGCMNMMGPLEQADTASMIEWIAAQAWSDGKVGMHGVSYVGTTPHEALIMAPPHLVTVVTIAGVTNQWRNVYQNGVPYDGRHYPLTYEAGQGAPPPLDVARGPGWAANTAEGACGQDEAIEAMSPGVYEKGIYSPYWDERNFTKNVGNVRASILYSQGFADRAVNPMESIFWFNDLPVPKKGFFHQGGHMLPPRQDYQDLELAWFDHWLKGMDTGILETPPVEVQLNDRSIRIGDAWPPTEAQPLALRLGPAELAETDVPIGEETYTANFVLDASPANVQPLLDATGTPSRLSFQGAPLEAPLHVAGVPWAHLKGSSDAANTFWLLDLYDIDENGTWDRLQEGWLNAHLRDGFERSAPLTPGEVYAFDFRFEPMEYVFPAGHQVGLRISGYDARVFPIDEPVTENTILYGPEGSWIELPVLPAPTVHSGEGINIEAAAGGLLSQSDR